MLVNKRKYADDVCVYSQMIRCTYVIYAIPSQIFSVVVALYEDMLQILLVYFCDTHFGSESNMLFKDYFISLGLNLFKITLSMTLLGLLMVLRFCGPCQGVK